MPLAPNPHAYPPDGFIFDDADGIRHRGDDWPDLVRRVREYRLQNGKEPGNPLEEINKFTCNRFPEGCREIRTIYPGKGTAIPRAEPGADKPVRFSTLIVRWLYAIARAMGERPAPLVSKEEAQRRADICMQCPKQKGWTVECGTCAGSIFRVALSVRKNQEVVHADRLSGCGVLGEDTRTSVFLPRLEPVVNDELPDACWRKKSNDRKV